MNDVSLLRLYLLRAMYLLVVVGLGIVIWPGILSHAQPWELKQGVVMCMLGAFSLLCALGLRYPLLMLPVLLWELAWKAMWLLIVALPAWRSGTMDAGIMATAIDCALVVLVPMVIPWGYVMRHYVRRDGDRWKNAAA